MTNRRNLVWFRGKDLRLNDHRPLTEGLNAQETLCLFVLDPYFFEPERARRLPHRIQFLLDSLVELQESIRARGGDLLVVKGRSVELLPRVVKAWGVDRVVAYRWSEPIGRERDQRISRELEVPFDLFEGETLHDAGSVRTKTGTPYRVYTPFARAVEKQLLDRELLPAPDVMPPVPPDVVSDTVALPSLSELGLTRNDNILKGGESEARSRLQSFLSVRAADYAAGRNRLGQEQTSRLSADLKFGTVSVWEAWNSLKRWPQGNDESRTAFGRGATGTSRRSAPS